MSDSEQRAAQPSAQPTAQTTVDAPIDPSDGLPMPPDYQGYVDPPAPAREFTAENVPCLRGFNGQCRYYWQFRYHFPAGNSGETFTERKHYCMRQPGVETELAADVPIYECSQWDPGDRDEAESLSYRRKLYFDRNPNHEEKHDANDSGDGPDNAAD